MLQLQEFPILRRTDRDLEIPVLVDFLHRISGNVESALDVGAQFSAGYYAPELRKTARIYHGLDPLPDPQTEKIVDKMIQADAVDFDFPAYDLITCVSVLEHLGQYPTVYQNYRYLRYKVFEKMLNAAKKFLWVSFPVGLNYQEAGEMSIFNEQELEFILGLIKPYKNEVGFYFTEGAQAGYPWQPSIREKCVNQAYQKHLGTQALCVIEVTK